jgi:hypothetical protein
MSRVEESEYKLGLECLIGGLDLIVKMLAEWLLQMTELKVSSKETTVGVASETFNEWKK